MLGRYSLEEYYKENFSMMTHGDFSLTELDNMVLFEREIYAAQLIHYIKEKNKESQ
jgi:hypothetical protein